jgi:hypothetical protein
LLNFFSLFKILIIICIFSGGFLSLFEFIRWLFFFNLLIALLVIVFIIAPELSYKKEDINNNNNVSNCTNPTLDDCQYCYDQYLTENIQYDPLNILLGIIKGKVNIFFYLFERSFFFKS